MTIIESKGTMETKTKAFLFSHSKTTTADSAAIWSLWSDIENWPKWDSGIARCQLEGDFEAGNTFELAVRNEAPITIELTEVVKNVKFADVARPPFGTIRTIHEMKETGDGLEVIHTMKAEINEAQAEFFEQNIWGHITQGLPNSVANLVALAEDNQR